MGAIEKLKILIEQRGLKLSDVEKELKFPANNLSAALKGKRRVGDKWETKIEAWIENIENPISFPYLIKERDCQLILMKGLGIPTDSGATFEQLVNTVIFVAGDYKNKWQEAEKKIKELPAIAKIKFMDTTKEVKVQNLTQEQPKTNYEINTLTERLKVLNTELANPPKSPIIGQRAWINAREMEKKEIEFKLNNH